MNARTSKNRYENCSMDFDIRCPIVIERTKSHSTNQRFISTSIHIWLFNSREGSYARLMKVNFDRLIDGAVEAVKTSFDGIGSTAPDVAILSVAPVENVFSSSELKKRWTVCEKFLENRPY